MYCRQHGDGNKIPLVRINIYTDVSALNAKQMIKLYFEKDFKKL